ncbi:hypothetical protein [Sphingobacterium siyangense]|uniref:hypothetical protein n=1 Tax=Sphingobacterium siyangense TaxID=459529 RepID=UPI0019652F2C|nr:hypothetical protein [Sphingobacterium siyangense]QRY55962.1 hypothetical protein JVX97_18255 [Sphingobacterium siyangense]
MKNLIPLNSTIPHWDAIVNVMRLTNRRPLHAIRGAIVLRFTEYLQFSTPNNLENIPASIYAGALATSLRTCYNSRSAGIESLRQDIRDAQQEFLKGECQYCNIGEPSTMDHYLPQDEFPEFSALSINLLPCCSTCNSEKGEEWVVGGVRRILNYYYDDLPNVNYLFCTITFRNGNAVANFSLDTNAVPAGIAGVITNHFADLDLLERYRTRSAGEIVEVHDAIMQKVNKNLLGIRAELIQDAIALKNRKGANYWRAVLKIALANSDQFLQSAGFW